MLILYWRGKEMGIQTSYLKREIICKWMARRTQIRNEKKRDALIWLWKGGNPSI
jgi:hypothetical protein